MRKDGKKVNRYRVNFTSDLSATLAEVKYLEKLGFTVPDVARNMSIQVSNSDLGCIPTMFTPAVTVIPSGLTKLSLKPTVIVSKYFQYKKIVFREQELSL